MLKSFFPKWFPVFFPIGVVVFTALSAVQSAAQSLGASDMRMPYSGVGSDEPWKPTIERRFGSILLSPREDQHYASGTVARYGQRRILLQSENGLVNLSFKHAIIEAVYGHATIERAYAVFDQLDQKRGFYSEYQMDLPEYAGRVIAPGQELVISRLPFAPQFGSNPNIFIRPWIKRFVLEFARPVNPAKLEIETLRTDLNTAWPAQKARAIQLQCELLFRPTMSNASF